MLGSAQTDGAPGLLGQHCWRLWGEILQWVLEFVGYIYTSNQFCNEHPLPTWEYLNINLYRNNYPTWMKAQETPVLGKTNWKEVKMAFQLLSFLAPGWIWGQTLQWVLNHGGLLQCNDPECWLGADIELVTKIICLDKISNPTWMQGEERTEHCSPVIKICSSPLEDLKFLTLQKI